MHLLSLKTVLFLIGIALVAYGYHLLSIPPDAAYEMVMARARRGMFFVVGGGTFLMLWLAKR